MLRDGWTTSCATVRKGAARRDLVDLDDLIRLPVALLRDDPALADRYRTRWPWIFVDEYQDVDDVQYELLRLLCPADGNLCAIGDPDQAIYSFRGADVAFFLRFDDDFADARVVRLTRNYRSSAPILAAAVQAIAPTTLVRGRRLDPARLDPEALPIGLYPAASTADEADFVVRTIDELVGGLSHRSLDSGRIDVHARPGRDELRRHRRALPHRRPGRPDRRRAVPGRGTGAEALARPAARPARGRGDRPRAAVRHGTGRVARGPGAADRPAAGRAADARRGRRARPRPTCTQRSTCSRRWPQRCGDDLPRFLAEIATGAEVDALDPRARGGRRC